jgi:hypothetical protein
MGEKNAMNMKILVILSVVLLFCGCTKRIADPVNEAAVSFQIVDCDEADEFFSGDPNSPAKPYGYYACACPSQDSDTVTIFAYLSEPMRLTVIIRNATGYDLRNYSGQYGPGSVEIKWDRKSKKGKRVKPGIYIINMRTERHQEADVILVLE